MKSTHRTVVIAGMAMAALALAAPSVMARACRVTDFTERTLGSLNEVERLSFVIDMTQTEYNRLKAAAPGSANYYELLARSENTRAARETARVKLESLKLENIDGYRRFWGSDFLTDEQLRKLADCESSRQPGLAVYGRSEDPAEFHLTYVHITPVGIEKILTRVVASANIANLAGFEAALAELGPRDNYPARTFALKLADPKKPAVLLLRAGWETPLLVYIPVYPTPDYFK